MSERIVHKISKHQYANFGRKTVVIYARVSTNKPSQLHSMAMQVSALTQQVYRLWHWRLADIYIDFGSKASNDRSEFQRMIHDCIHKQYDMVLAKSVSHFGQDTLDGLNAIRKLKEHGVEVYFDLEELKSFQPDFELHYSIRAAIARGERENIHDNIAMSINQKFMKEPPASIPVRVTAIVRQKTAPS